MLKRITYLFLLIILSHSVILCGESSLHPQSGNPNFIENKGQWNSEILFLASFNNLNVWITKKGLVYDSYSLNNKTKIGHVVNVKYSGNEAAEYYTDTPQSEYFNYFIGNDTSKWRSDVHLYRDVTIKNIFSGIDIRYYFDKVEDLNQKSYSLRYDFIVNPGADVSDILLKFEGHDGIQISDSGNIC